MAVLALFLVVAAVMRNSGNRAAFIPSVLSESNRATLLSRFDDSERPFSLLYPASWQPDPFAKGLAIWPDTKGEGFAERGAAFFVYTSGPGDSARPPALPELLAAAAEQGEMRLAENVAVGGLSGEESVTKITLDEESRSPFDATIRNALQQASASTVTLIGWKAVEGETSYHVLMVDARDGRYLGMLEQIRDSIQWKR